ncbi:hypothetical protein GOBAR_DD30835 [Gossypium barbadense]|nr:hypothetical protein GOBAR_DD30835 [Gossypium barbadense]
MLANAANRSRFTVFLRFARNGQKNSCVSASERIAEATCGYYYGKIKFPPEYPYKPPGITSSRKLEFNVVCIKVTCAEEEAMLSQEAYILDSSPKS